MEKENIRDMYVAGIKIVEEDEVEKVALLLTKSQIERMLRREKVPIPPGLTKNELLVYATIKGALQANFMVTLLRESGKEEKARAIGPDQRVSAMKLLEKKPRRRASRAPMARRASGTASRARKYQDANGRWRWASGAKKGKFAPAPRK